MGYETDFTGVIELSSRARAEQLLDALSKQVGPCAYWTECVTIDCVSAILRVETSAKCYYDQLEKFCVFISTLDSGASGDIECQGEDWWDLWRITIGAGKVWVERGEVQYVDAKRFEDAGAARSVRAFLKDGGCG